MTDAKEKLEHFKRHINVSRETIERLEVFNSELHRWNDKINLVSRASLSHVWDRHFLDSAQIWSLKPKTVHTWLDLGSGAGFPGLVLAAMAREESPDLRFTLVESDHRKAAFLIHLAQTLDLKVIIKQNRIESLDPQAADVISARALAPLEKLLGLAQRHSKDSTIMLFQKGEKAESELTQARKYWTFDLNKTPSVTDSGGVLLRIGGLGRVKP